MKHKHANRTLSRTANHRRALLRNLSRDLLAHGSIVTTEARAKELRRYIEPLITKAKQEPTLHRRRQLLAEVSTVTLKRLHEVAQQHDKRPGGYLRLTKLPRTREDNAPTVRVDILDANEQK